MNIWAIANQKGGVGKTTTTVSLGALLAEKNQKVLLIDLDPHGSLSHYLRAIKSNDNFGGYTLFSESTLTRTSVLSLVQETKFKNLDILPSAVSLSTLDRNSKIKKGLGLVLSRALALIANDYDFVLIDCPPMIGVLMINALASCSLLLIPVQTESLAIHGLSSMLDTLNIVKDSNNMNIDFMIVPTLYDRRTRACQKALQKINKLHSGLVWHSTIPLDTRFREASCCGMPISQYAASSKGTWSYNLLLKNLLQKIVAKKRALIN